MHGFSQICVIVASIDRVFGNAKILAFRGGLMDLLSTIEKGFCFSVVN